MAPWDQGINIKNNFLRIDMITTLPKSLLEASSNKLEASLYESILLLENRIEFLKKNNPRAKEYGLV